MTVFEIQLKIIGHYAGYIHRLTRNFQMAYSNE